MIGHTWLCTPSENDKCMYHNVVSVIIHYYGILSLKVEVLQQGLISDGCKTMANIVKKLNRGWVHKGWSESRLYKTSTSFRVVYVCLDDILHINDLMNLAKRTRNIYDRMEEKKHFIGEANNCLYSYCRRFLFKYLMNWCLLK